ncbi:MAG TPA: ABC transporter ATP-binding protein [Candidatus Polarisedimenticolia bacterium]|nr:ABC transporter ATP-binding protein [Candidatus Polarisedimenticolia bacterium]
MGIAIRADNLGKVYVKRRSLREMALRPLGRAARVTALKDVTIAVESGEIYGLLGPNGAGKTTLLKILAGLVLPNEGSAQVGGIDVARDDRAVKRLIGFVTADERSFYWRLTGRENLHFFARLYGLELTRARRRAVELMEAVDLGGVSDQQFMSYSSGMKQRLAIARALLHDPPILCLDEPTRSLDPIAAKHLRRFVVERLNRDSGKTVLLATHNLQEAEELCGRLAILDRGRVLRQGSIAVITADLPGRDHYILTVAGLDGIPRDARWTLELERRDGAATRLSAAVERGGTAFSDLLAAILAGHGTILACGRREPSLQEVFDRIEAAAPAPGQP